MSHEGIRIGPENAARKAIEEREFPQNAVTPLHVRINKTQGTGVEIDWKDGHTSHWTFQWLRDACPCATCNEEREVSGREPGQPKPAAKTALPMFKEPVRPTEVRAVGRYAIGFDWNDGHTSGIFSWHYLRSMCRCAACISDAASHAAIS